MRKTRFVVIAALSLIAACGDKDPTGVNAGVSGTVSFNYTGGGGGTFNATGSILSTATSSMAHTTNWGAGWKDNSDNSTVVEGNQATSGGLANTAAIIIDRQTAGTSTIDPNCSANVCTDVVFLIGSNATGSTFSFLCVLETGTVTIASISNANATGTFSGSGSCVASGGQTSTFAVSNGSFNVPLLQNIPTF